MGKVNRNYEYFLNFLNNFFSNYYKMYFKDKFSAKKEALFCRKGFLLFINFRGIFEAYAQ